MTVMEEQQPLLGLGNANRTEEQDCLERGVPRLGLGRHEPGVDADADADADATRTSSQSWKEWTAERLEAPSTHKAVILLIAIDAGCVLADLVYTFLQAEKECANTTSGHLTRNEPVWLTILAHISLAITTLFLLEIPLALWCFGPAYYNTFAKASGDGDGDGGSEDKHPYAALHLFDAFVVLTTFVLEVVLRGREAELAGLLILLRLWRLVKLVGGLAKGAGELQEELANKLEETERLLEEERARTQKLVEENDKLRAQIEDAAVAAEHANAQNEAYE